MAKPERVRITLNGKNEVESVEVQLNGKWVETKEGNCCKTEDREGDAVIRVGHIAEPNSCTHDPRCQNVPDECSVYISGMCYHYYC